MAENNPDVLLIVGGEKFPCHRKVLKNASSYFSAMFTSDMLENHASEVELHDVKPEAFSLLLEFAYHRYIGINQNNVFDLLETAAYLQFSGLVDECVSYLLNILDYTNCIQVWVIADMMNLEVLLKQAKQIVLWEFEFVANSLEFCELPKRLLLEVLPHDGLIINREMEVFYSIIKWIESNQRLRSDNLLELFICIRFACLSAREINEICAHPFMEFDPLVKKLLVNILDTSVLKKSKNSCISTFKLKDHVRLDHSYRELLIIEGKTFDSYVTDNSNLSDVKEKLKIIECKHSEIVSSGQGTSSQETQDEYFKLWKDVLSFVFCKGKRCVPVSPIMIGTEISGIDKIPGENSHGLLQGLIYNESKESFEMLTSLYVGEQRSSPLKGYSACCVGKNIYILGGEYGIGTGRWNKNVWMFDVFQKKWSLVSVMPSSRRHFQTCVLNGCLYLLGGFGSYRVVLFSVECYNTKTGWLQQIIHLAYASLDVDSHKLFQVCSHQNRHLAISILLLTSAICWRRLQTSVWAVPHPFFTHYLHHLAVSSIYQLPSVTILHTPHWL
ncbi:kelch-like protein 17 isoform X2 [Limulus polyphemus]|uniref:Kelch-like protein diablo n=1 Tax=Limulus polyphemus TaxID=6850 RepID=A0ABM1RWE9_LIMPO|nr:kelch-like protein 17 isoform X2 [Limulus polyphemus]